MVNFSLLTPGNTLSIEGVYIYGKVGPLRLVDAEEDLVTLNFA